MSGWFGKMLDSVSPPYVGREVHEWAEEVRRKEMKRKRSIRAALSPQSPPKRFDDEMGIGEKL